MEQDKKATESNFAAIVIGLIVILWIFILFYFCTKNPILCLIEFLFGAQPGYYNINTAFGIV